MSATEVQIRDGSSQGLRALHDHLDFAATGRLPQIDRVGSSEPDSPFEEAIMAVVNQLGYEAVPQVGVEGFFIDIGVRHPDRPGRFLMGIECDGATYHSSRDARDRDRLRQEILEGLGWSLHRIWSTDWFTDPARERKRLLRALERRLDEERGTARSPSPVWVPPDETPASGIVDSEPSPEAELPLLQPASETSLAAKSASTGRVHVDAEQRREQQSALHEAQIGDMIVVEKLDDSRERMRFVLTKDHNDPDTGFVSLTRPLGDAVLGAQEDEEVAYAVGVYERRVRVVSIQRGGQPS